MGSTPAPPPFRVQASIDLHEPISAITIHQMLFLTSGQNQMVFFPICCHNLFKLSLSESSQAIISPKKGNDCASAGLNMVGFRVQSCSGLFINNAKVEKLLFSLMPVAAQKRLVRHEQD